MGYTEGMAIAEAFVKRNDGWFGKKKAKCDPRYGWKTGAGGKCVRVSPEEDPNKGYGTNVFLSEAEKDGIESNGGSKYIDDFQKKHSTDRETAVIVINDLYRVYARGGGRKEADEAWNHHEKALKNKYGTRAYVSSDEADFIDNAAGGLGKVKGLSKKEEINYLKDLYNNHIQGGDLRDVNRHYFGDK